VIIGLTATPPYDKTNSKKQIYLEIMGKVDYQVPIPAVVKDGNLAPFRDIPFIVTPTEKEYLILKKENQAIYETIKDTEELGRREAVYSFSEYIEIFIKNPQFDNAPISFNDYYLKSPDTAIAMIKYILKNNLTVPIEIIIQPEMLEEISVYDYALIFQKYVYDYLDNISLKEPYKKKYLKI